MEPQTEALYYSRQSSKILCMHDAVFIDARNGLADHSAYSTRFCRVRGNVPHGQFGYPFAQSTPDIFPHNFNKLIIAPCIAPAFIIYEQIPKIVALSSQNDPLIYRVGPSHAEGYELCC
jgi:hypothetical protein